MSIAAARGPLQAPLSQWVMVGVGALYLANPEKFVSTIQQSALAMFVPPQNGFTDGNKQTIIYQTLPSSNGKSLTMYLIQLTIGAGFCWGSYMVLMNVLPDAAKAMLPVTTSVFNSAVKTLGRGILSVKETFLEQIGVLSKKQEELSDKQDDTHEQVLQVKDSVTEVRGDIGLVQESLDLCQESLTEAELRTTYIARGVRLLSRGVSSILPQDHDLAYELDQFNRETLKYNAKARAAAAAQVEGQQARSPAISLLARQQQQLQQARVAQQQDNPQQQTPMKKQVSLEDMDPENEVPVTPVMTMEDLDEVRLLLSRVKAGSVY
jgi:hypothetical protein